jgi:tellurite resistance protein
MPSAKIPLNFFGMGFGLAGLATAWRVAVDLDLAPHWVSDTLVAVATLVWTISCLLYLRYALTTRGAFVRDLRDMTAGPFASLALITPVLLVAGGIAPYTHDLATVLIDILDVAILALGGWFTGFWMRGGVELDRLHPGYFLPTVAGGLVASAGAAEVGQVRLAQLMLGLGLICWVIVGSMILGRLIFRPPLPDALAPTMAIEVAPAAVASVAYLFSTGGHVDRFAAILAGYGLLMVTAQLPLLPRYLHLKFSLGTWAFTFSWAAVASTALFWIASGHPAGERLYSYLVLGAISVLIGGVAARTVVALARGALLPPAPAAPAASPPLASGRPTPHHTTARSTS